MHSINDMGCWNIAGKSFGEYLNQKLPLWWYACLVFTSQKTDKGPLYIRGGLNGGAGGLKLPNFHYNNEKSDFSTNAQSKFLSFVINCVPEPLCLVQKTL